jgi:hypothetical protein
MVSMFIGRVIIITDKYILYFRVILEYLNNHLMMIKMINYL